MKCPICGSDVVEEHPALYDDRYGYKGRFDLLLCNSCDHRFLDTTFTNEQISELYKEYYQRDANIEQFEPEREESRFAAWFNGSKSRTYAWVPASVRILDIGCGLGESLAFHQRRGCDVYGIDADENAARIAAKQGLTIHVGTFEECMFAPDFFDYVTMDQSIEHVSDPLATFRNIAGVLKANGTAVISTPNAAGWGAGLFRRKWINWHTPYHLQLFSQKSLSIAAESAGLSIQEFHTITESEWLHYQWLHLLTYPEEGKASPFWTGNKDFYFLKKIARILFIVLHKMKINHFITRIFDVIGTGDNMLVILRQSNVGERAN